MLFLVIFSAANVQQIFYLAKNKLPLQKKN